MMSTTHEQILPPMHTSIRRFDLVLSDVDGCLTPEEPLAFDDQALASIADSNRAAQRDGDRPLLTLCTGRPVPFAEALCRLVQNMTVPCIAEGGVWVFHPGRNEFQMDPAITDSDLNAVHEAEAYLRRDYGRRGFTVQPGKTASVSLYHPDHRVLLATVPELQETARSKGWPLRISATWRYLNCDLAHVSKGTGIRRLLEQCPVAPDRLAGIGDTLGDRYIAEAVGWFGCPANADPEIQVLAAYVSPHPEARGVLDLLAQLRG
jgi:hydroxymethylpyrimidine pyrophosphatase-like HAD family hydrolase